MLPLITVVPVVTGGISSLTIEILVLQVVFAPSVQIAVMDTLPLFSMVQL